MIEPLTDYDLQRFCGSLNVVHLAELLRFLHIPCHPKTSSCMNSFELDRHSVGRQLANGNKSSCTAMIIDSCLHEILSTPKYRHMSIHVIQVNTESPYNKYKFHAGIDIHMAPHTALKVNFQPSQAISGITNTII